MRKKQGSLAKGRDGMQDGAGEQAKAHHGGGSGWNIIGIGPDGPFGGASGPGHDR